MFRNKYKITWRKERHLVAFEQTKLHQMCIVENYLGKMYFSVCIIHKYCQRLRSSQLNCPQSLTSGHSISPAEPVFKQCYLKNGFQSRITSPVSYKTAAKIIRYTKFDLNMFSKALNVIFFILNNLSKSLNFVSDLAL